MNLPKWILLILCFSGWYFIVRRQSLTEMQTLFDEPISTNWQSELNTRPLITDIDGDGTNEIVIAPYDAAKLQIFKFKKGKLELEKEASLPENIFPVFITSGYEEAYKPGERRKQIIIVIMRNYEVYCFNSDLSLRWKQDHYIEEGRAFVHEISAVVLPYQIREKIRGMVVCAFRTTNDRGFSKHRADDVFEQDVRAGFNEQNYDEQEEQTYENDEEYEEMEKFLVEHINYYALNLKDGEIIWEHERDDEDDVGDNIDHAKREIDYLEVYQEMRLQAAYDHEWHSIEWHEFHDCIYQHLPHTWTSFFDTKMVPAHFSRDVELSPPEYIQPKTRIQSNYNDFDLIKNPNVLLIHHMNGIEVVHLFTGKSVLHMTLITSTTASGSSFVDFNGDDILDEITTYSQLDYHELYHMGDDANCQLEIKVASSGEDQFEYNVCEKQNRFDLLRNIHKNKQRRSIQFLSPLLIKNHKFTAHDGRPTYDIYHLNSDGLLTAIDHTGKLLYQKTIDVTWKMNEVDMPTFKPYLAEYPFVYENNKSHTFMIAQGDTSINILDLQGNVVSSKKFDHIEHPIMLPIYGDINNDGKNDVIIVTEKRIMGFNVKIVPPTDYISVLIGIIVLILSYAVYTIAMNYYRRNE